MVSKVIAIHFDSSNQFTFISIKLVYFDVWLLSCDLTENKLGIGRGVRDTSGRAEAVWLVLTSNAIIGSHPSISNQHHGNSIPSYGIEIWSWVNPFSDVMSILYLICVFVMHIFTVGLVVSVMHVFTTDSFVSSHNGEGEADCGWSTS